MGENNKLKIKVALTGLGALVAILGLASFGIPSMSYLRSVLLGTAALMLFIELGVKLGTNFSPMKHFSAVQWAAMVVALLLTIDAIVALPFIGYNIAWLTEFSGFLMILGGTAIAWEAWHNMI